MNAGHCLVAAVSVPARRPSTDQDGCGARALVAKVPPARERLQWWEHHRGENVTFTRSWVLKMAKGAVSKYKIILNKEIKSVFDRKVSFKIKNTKVIEKGRHKNGLVWSARVL